MTELAIKLTAGQVGHDSIWSCLTIVPSDISKQMYI